MTINCAILTNSGIPTVPGTVCLKKDGNNLIGISIGGGAQYCPCLYIVQVSQELPTTSVCDTAFPNLLTYFIKIDSLFSTFLISPSVWLQVFDNTPAALDGTLAAGDEITGVNGKPVKGKTKVEVAKMIQAVQVQECWKIKLQGSFC